MNSIVEQVQQMAASDLKKIRWTLGLSGALSVALGVVIIAWPGISLFSLVLVFGAFAFARGVVGLGMALSGRIKQGRGWLIASSLAGIVVGVLVFGWTDMSALALLYVIGAYAITFGIIEVGGTFWLPLDSGTKALLGLTGFLSIVFGVVMFAKPGAGALVLLALIAAYCLTLGVAELTVAIGGKKLFERQVRRLTTAQPQQTHAQPQPSR